MPEKSLYWLGSSYDDLRKMPDEIQDVFGYALDLAQNGKRHQKAKPFKVPGESGVIEVVSDFDGDTFRAIYTISFADAVYVIHCFQKKSTIGIKTQKKDVDLVIERLKSLKAILRGDS